MDEPKCLRLISNTIEGCLETATPAIEPFVIPNRISSHNNTGPGAPRRKQMDSRLRPLMDFVKPGSGAVRSASLRLVAVGQGGHVPDCPGSCPSVAPDASTSKVQDRPGAPIVLPAAAGPAAAVWTANRPTPSPAIRRWRFRRRGGRKQSISPRSSSWTFRL